MHLWKEDPRGAHIAKLHLQVLLEKHFVSYILQMQMNSLGETHFLFLSNIGWDSF